MRRISATLSLAILCAALLVGASRIAAQAATPSPYQIVSVSTSRATATTGVIDLWQRDPNRGFLHVAGPYPVFVGELGVGATREGLARTPAGVFGLTEAFGNQPSNGTRLPYFQAGPYDSWNGESNSPNYNNHVHQAYSPGAASENLYTAGAVYAHAVVINYNRFPAIPGRGSAFFLHVTNGQPTAGCVAMRSHDLDTVMRWLNPALHPAISIGVGSAATAPVTQLNTAVARHNPFGYLDTVTAAGGGKVRIRGWAADPDNTRAPLTLELRANGRLVQYLRTGVPRPDAARIMGIGPNQGYDQTATVGHGTFTICVVAQNIGIGTGNTAFACQTRAVS